MRNPDLLAGSPRKAPVSAIILTRNEESNIAAVLENIFDLADELIVVDMQSEDKTVEIARRYTSHIYSHPLIPGFDAARNLGLDHASHEWILIIDADERLPERLQSKLREVVEKDLADYVSIQRCNFILGCPLRHGDNRHDWHIRLHKKTSATPWPESVHIEPRFHGRKLALPDNPDFTVLHYAVPTIASMLSRLQRYTPQEAIALQRAGHIFSPLKLVGAPAWLFLRSYVLKGGFRDGIPGLIYAAHSAYYAFLARACVWEAARPGTPAKAKPAPAGSRSK
jgi:glycosyltransferase involved in cell wall biosynthesis